VNSEFGKLASEEIRMLREYRAKKAISSGRSVSDAVVMSQWSIIREAALTLLELSPGSGRPLEILKLVPDSVCS
jgi:hypothetical protein